jgi:EmrB/QacA subfamily drug resistance transporter
MAQTVEHAAPPTYLWRWAALTALLAAEAMNLLDATIVQVAGPQIHADLGGPVSDIQWFSAAYTLPFAALLLTGGRLGDVAGRRRVFRLGVTGFLLMSLACALAPSAGLLIGFRAVQGAAAAVIIPQTFGLIRAMFGAHEISRALGSIGPVMGLTAVCGPVLGGVLTHADLLGSSWRAVFLVNVPIAVAVLIIAPWLIEDRAPQRPRLDPIGTVLVVIGTALVIYPLIGTARPAWTWAGIAAGLAVLAVFAGHQRRSALAGRPPLVEPSLFATRAFPAALVTSTLFFAALTGLTLVVVLQMQLGLGVGVLTAGLTLLPWSLGSALSSWTAGAYLVPRYGPRLMFAGLALLLTGVLAAIAAYHASSPTGYPIPLLPALAVAGLGAGLFTTPFFTTALHLVSPQETGSASGLLNAVQQLGGTLGVAVLGSIYLAAARPGNHAAALRAVQHAFWIAAALLVATTLAAAVMTRSGGPREHASPRLRHKPTAAPDNRPGAEPTAVLLPTDSASP